MPRLNEIKERRQVVETVGSFASSLQQIASMRMVKLRQTVLASRRFVNEATIILKELHLERLRQIDRDIKSGHLPKKPKNKPIKDKENLKTAVIIITSDQGLCGSYHNEIFSKLGPIIHDHPRADYFVIGKKGQHFCESYQRQAHFEYFPIDISDSVTLLELRPLIGMFYYYDQIYLVYSHFINTAKREVLFIELSVPNIEEVQLEQEKVEGKYIFEPNVEELISQVNSRIRYALFRQQILDSKLALYTAQMIAMKTASDNAQNLLGELKLEYNKARRKLVDKKINEVQAGRTLWATEN